MQTPASGSGVVAVKCCGDVPELPFSALAVHCAQPPWEMHTSALAAGRAVVWVCHQQPHVLFSGKVFPVNHSRFSFVSLTFKTLLPPPCPSIYILF